MAPRPLSRLPPLYYYTPQRIHGQSFSSALLFHRVIWELYITVSQFHQGFGLFHLIINNYCLKAFCVLGFCYWFASLPRELSYWMVIYRILHGKCTCTVFTHEFWHIKNQTSERSERLGFLIQKVSCSFVK